MCCKKPRDQKEVKNSKFMQRWGLANAHSGIRVSDMNADGRDEIVGAMIVDAKGQALFQLPLIGHIDSVFVADVRPDIPGLEAVALEEDNGLWLFEGSSSVSKILNRIINGVYIRLFAKDFRVFLYNSKGLIWENDYKGWEPQNAAIGDFDPDRRGLEIWCRSRFNTHQRPFVFDAFGNHLATYEMDAVAPKDWTIRGVEEISTIDWTGEARQLVAAKERHTSGDVAIFDAISGRFLHRFREKADRLYVADVYGDWREELIVLNGSQLRIYENDQPNPNPYRARLWEQNFYKRSKTTWNYYNP
jgi:hypothetical protein